MASNREDSYNRDEDRHYENNFRKEHETKRSHPSDKDEFNNDSYHRDFDRERDSNFSVKVSVSKIFIIIYFYYFHF